MSKKATKKVVLTPAQKEFQKLKRYVVKRFPDARTVMREGYYIVVNKNGYNVVLPELMLPPAKTVKGAWEQAKYSLWFINMIRKSNNAFSDEKIYRKLAKENND